MTRDEMLAAAARITKEHGKRHAGRVPLKPADSRPHAGPGGPSDYVEHAHLMSAPSDVDDELNRRLAALLARYRASLGEDREQVERRYNFRDYWLHGKGAAR